MSEENTFELPEFELSSFSATEEPVETLVEEKPVDESGEKVKEEETEELTLAPESEETEASEGTQASAEEQPSSKGIDSSSRKSASRTLAKALYEEGILSDYDEEEIKEDDGLDVVFNMINKELDSKVQNYVDGLDGNLKDIAEAIDAGVDIDEYKRLKSSEVQLDRITDEQIEDSEDIRRKLLTSFYKETTSLADTKIKKLIDRSVDLDEDVEEAKNAKVDLVKIRRNKEKALVEQAQVNKAAMQQDATKKLSAIQSKIDATEEIIPGIPLNKRDRVNLYNTLTEVVDSVKDASGREIPLNAVMANRSKNPNQWDMVVAHFHQLGLLNFEKDGVWKPNFSKLTKTAKSNAVADLQNVLETETGIKTSKSTYNKRQGEIISDLESLPTLNKGKSRF